MARLHEVPGCRVLSIEDGHEAGVVMHVRGWRCAGRCPVIKRHPELTPLRHEDLTPMLISHT